MRRPPQHLLLLRRPAFLRTRRPFDRAHRQMVLFNVGRECGQHRFWLTVDHRDAVPVTWWSLRCLTTCRYFQSAPGCLRVCFTMFLARAGHSPPHLQHCLDGRPTHRQPRAEASGLRRRFNWLNANTAPVSRSLWSIPRAARSRVSISITVVRQLAGLCRCPCVPLSPLCAGRRSTTRPPGPGSSPSSLSRLSSTSSVCLAALRSQANTVSADALDPRHTADPLPLPAAPGSPECLVARPTAIEQRALGSTKALLHSRHNHRVSCLGAAC